MVITRGAVHSRNGPGILESLLRRIRAALLRQSSPRKPAATRAALLPGKKERSGYSAARAARRKQAARKFFRDSFLIAPCRYPNRRTHRPAQLDRLRFAPIPCPERIQKFADQPTQNGFADHERDAHADELFFSPTGNAAVMQLAGSRTVGVGPDRRTVI